MFRKIKLFLYTFLFLISSTISYGQYYSLGNDPSSTKWMQIKTDNYYLIYPKETDSLARVYLAHLETQRTSVYSSLGLMPKRIPVILHPYNTISNGMVAWNPKRSELITSPDPYSGSADWWPSHLTLHEMRHIGQMENYTKGIYNIFYYLLGEHVSALGIGLFTTIYSMEGDAVITETEFSQGGRGRSADFLRLQRTQFLKEHRRNYDRSYFGS